MKMTAPLGRLVYARRLFLCLVALCAACNSSPNSRPSKVVVRDGSLFVSAPAENGAWKGEQRFPIKGVCWSPASLGATGERKSRIDEFGRWAEKDLAQIKAMNANAVYTFLDFGDGPDALAILDQAYKAGIMVIPTVDFDGTDDKERAKLIVKRYKNHPAILMWAIGNEWNINLYHGRFQTLMDAAKATEETARLIKSIDTAHPVAAIFGEIIIPNQSPSTKEIVNTIAPSVDVWGLNIYRGGTFGTLFDQWRAITDKPLFLSEFGTDSYYSTNWWPVQGREDQRMQADFLTGLIKEMHSQKGSLGGTIFEWNDEWWKVKVSDGGSLMRQDLSGFPTPWNKYSHPDSFANEEYFGLVKLDREPKAAYYSVQKAYGEIK